MHIVFEKLYNYTHNINKNGFHDQVKITMILLPSLWLSVKKKWAVEETTKIVAIMNKILIVLRLLFTTSLYDFK